MCAQLKSNFVHWNKIICQLEWIFCQLNWNKVFRTEINILQLKYSVLCFAFMCHRIIVRWYVYQTRDRPISFFETDTDIFIFLPIFGQLPIFEWPLIPIFQNFLTDIFADILTTVSILVKYGANCLQAA